MRMLRQADRALIRHLPQTCIATIACKQPAPMLSVLTYEHNDDAATYMYSHCEAKSSYTGQLHFATKQNTAAIAFPHASLNPSSMTKHCKHTLRHQARRVDSYGQHAGSGHSYK